MTDHRRRPRWAIDWDGTCVEDAWPAMGDWNPGAIEALRTLSLHGNVVIHTCRNAQVEIDEITPNPVAAAQQTANIRAMLDAQGLHDVRVWTKGYKPPAVAYVDNRGVHYNGRKGAWKALVPKLLVMAGITPVFDTESVQ